MTFDVKYTSRFKKDYKLCQKRGLDVAKLLAVIDMLRQEITLGPEYHDHPLSGDYISHSDLFGQ